MQILCQVFISSFGAAEVAEDASRQMTIMLLRGGALHTTRLLLIEVA